MTDPIAKDRHPAIPVPKGGFASHEEEARWLADTITMRMQETAANIGASIKVPNDSLYDLLLLGLQSAAKRDGKKLRAENADLERTFDLMWDADQRAIKRWQEANPGNDLVWPDRSKLTEWLLDRADLATDPEHPSPQAEDGWRPIETAPWRQCVILSRLGERLCVTAYRHAPSQGWRHAHSSDAICFEPTHWQPLPAPPAPETTDGK